MSKFLLVSLPNAYNIKLKDKLQHTIFGPVVVEFISQDAADFTLMCRLMDYNDTLKPFKAMDFIKMGKKHKPRLRVIRDDS